ncbi:AEC family transporter [Glaciecola sp. 2405UD65-10]|uniref:AEC family transporter n=1 Tax=Glaciecola sp. 2405UD65-10 TaxID=3397244 RepID=UPI003B5A81E1
MSNELNFLSFAAEVIGPVILMLAFGYGLYKYGTLNDEFIERASRLVFNLALPALLFSSISSSSVAQLSDATVISVGFIGTLGVFAMLLFTVPYLVKQKADRGVVIQGAFRSNMGIIGLAYCANAYGPEGLAYASVYMGGLTILYNVLSVVALNVYQDKQTSWSKITKDILTNPIIISIVLGLLVSILQVPIPAIMSNSVEYFAQLTLPLALLCAGAALRFSTMKANGISAVLSITVKCIVYPFVLVLLALQLGVSGMPLMVIYLMAVSPTAAASYVMVRKIGGNHGLAAQIIAISTVLSVPITLLGYGFIYPYIYT